jgi:hypothetical protein
MMMMMMQAVAKGEKGLKRAHLASVRGGGGGGGGGENDDASAMSQTSTSNLSDIDDVSIDTDTKSSLQDMMTTTKLYPPHHPSIDTSTNYPYHSYLKSLPRWKWLNADTLPVPKSMISNAEGELLQ